MSFAFVLNAQEYLDKAEDNRTAFGLFFGVGTNQHTADFKGVDFPQVPSCCPRFESGSGFGYNFGLLYDLPLSENWLLQFRGIYQNLSGTLTTVEPTVVSSPEGHATDGSFEHSVEAMFASAGLQPMLGYRITKRFLLSLGFDAAYLLSKDFEQKETLKEPSFGTFYGTNKRVRNEYSGTLSNPSSFLISAVFSVGYYFPLNKEESFYLVPEINYFYGFTDIASDINWKVNQLTAGIALKWAPRKVKPPKVAPPPPPPPPLPLPPPPPQQPILDAHIVAVAVDENGMESPMAKLKVEQFLTSRMHPLLNYVFFDENSSQLPARYIRLTKDETRKFNVRKLYNKSTLDVYHNVLNIVGKRVKMYPQAEITLVGCNTDLGPEKGNTALSKSRAESVKDYLVNVWGIPSSRITVKSRNLPEIPSNVTQTDGQAENRRVEIHTNIDKIFEPLIIQDTLIESNPPVFRFKPTINAQMGIKEWKIVTSQSNGDIKTFEGTGKPPTSIEWDLSKEYEVVPKLNEPLNYRLQVVDNDNKVWASPVQSLPVEQYTIERKILEQIEDKEIDKFSLILFGYNQFELGEANKKIVQFAKRRIYPNSEVRILGYSDRIGDARYNLELSQKRANAAAKALGVSPKNAKGLGNSTLLYDNDLPEGRFYCRTVTIDIITPIVYE
jgi:outer membrane protein OmpA-like peptidoglycan-associated protein